MIEMNELTSAALRLAEEYIQADPNLLAIYLFPDESGKEIRLVEVDPTGMPSEDDQIEPFSFAADDAGGIPFRLAVAQIPPEEVGKVNTPEAWGGWRNAVRIWPKGEV
jgi:hypothetical protein